MAALKVVHALEHEILLCVGESFAGSQDCDAVHYSFLCLASWLSEFGKMLEFLHIHLNHM